MDSVKKNIVGSMISLFHDALENSLKTNIDPDIYITQYCTNALIMPNIDVSKKSVIDILHLMKDRHGKFYIFNSYDNATIRNRIKMCIAYRNAVQFAISEFRYFYREYSNNPSRADIEAANMFLSQHNLILNPIYDSASVMQLEKLDQYVIHFDEVFKYTQDFILEIQNQLASLKINDKYNDYYYEDSKLDVWNKLLSKFGEKFLIKMALLTINSPLDYNDIRSLLNILDKINTANHSETDVETD